jgi:hypothetical protein
VVDGQRAAAAHCGKRDDLAALDQTEQVIPDATGICEIEYELRLACWAGWRRDSGVEALLPSIRGRPAVGSDW